MTIGGCLPVVATPFSADESVDVGGLREIVELNIDCGVDALTCFGLASELYKLDEADRGLILDTLMTTTQGRVPVIVGCEHSGSRAAVHRCAQAAQFGASAVMLLPPSFTVPAPSSIRDYFLRCADACDVSVIVQDAPTWTGVELPVDLLVELHEEDARINTVKLEAPPISEKSRQLREAGMSVVSGYGAVHLYEDVTLRSINGFMPGCAFPEVMVRLWSCATSEDRDEFAELYERILPLLIAELTDLDTFIEVQKRALVMRGLLSSTTCREPHRAIAADRWRYLDRLIEKALALGRKVASDDIV